MATSINSTMIERPTAYGNLPSGTYKICKVIVPSSPTLVGGGAGEAVTTSFTFSDEDFMPSSTTYSIYASADQPCAVSWDNKATTGFDIVLTPLDSGDTLAAGAIDVEVTWTIPVGG